MARGDPADALRKVLLRERRILRSGKIGDLGDLMEEKTRCLARAAEIRDPETLRSLQRLAERNQALLAAAAGGLRAAASRLAQLREGLGSLSTYAEDGDRKGPPAPSSRLERRA